MGETERGICYSDRVKRAREIDLEKRFGSKEKIYNPENAAEARVQDIAIKILSYEKQLNSNDMNPIVKPRLDRILTELNNQIGSEA